MKNRFMSILLTLVLATILAACTSVPNVGSAVAVSETSCTKHEQEGCLELQIENLQFDARHPLMRGLEIVPAPSAAERARRVETLAPELLKAYMRGEVNAAAEEVYDIYVWKIDTSVSIGQMASWRLNGKTVSRGSVEDVTHKVAPPVLGAGSTLGKPDRVYRVTASGMNAAVVSFQAPWPFFTKDTVIMIKSTRLTVYPGAGNGLWITAKYLDTMRVKKWKWALLAFLHRNTEQSSSVLAAK